MARTESRSSSMASIAIIGLVFMVIAGQCNGQVLGYYKNKCGTTDVENEIYKVVSNAYKADKAIVAHLLRLLFHDGYSGMDGSLLLNGPERTHKNNLSVKGYPVIDAAKAALEAKCPNLVSCTDILVVATRVSVYLAGGPWYSVETGRRDSLTSNLNDAANLPSPTMSVSDAVSKFALRQLSKADFVALLGCHTVGVMHCSFFIERLYNFQSTGSADPTIAPATLTYFKNTCPKSGSNNFVSADQTAGSALRFDNGFFKAIKAGQATIQIDARMASDPITKDIVTNFATTGNFITYFPNAINKLAKWKVLTGTQGQIRKNCNRIN